MNESTENKSQYFVRTAAVLKLDTYANPRLYIRNVKYYDSLILLLLLYQKLFCKFIDVEFSMEITFQT